MRDARPLTAETELGHRRGVVLGLTMAELLLLLVFCLLLASVAVLNDKQKQIEKLAAEPAAVGASAAEELRATRTELQNFTENAPAEFQHLQQPIPSKDWKELVRARDIVRAAERNGSVLTQVPNAEELAAAAQLEQIAAARHVGVDVLVKELQAPPPKEAGHNWPPIITLGSDRFRFPLNSAELSPDFRQRLQTEVADQVRALLRQYDVDVVEVVGHTDEQPIFSTQQSTLDFDAIAALRGDRPIADLKPADNAGLGLARAIAVANALRASGLPANVKIIPLSAAQLVMPGDLVSDGSDGSDSPQRRRIEIRVRRSTESLPQ
jgi:outer membrane protein OmpA-like peptidoglycan-associated protein